MAVASLTGIVGTKHPGGRMSSTTSNMLVADDSRVTRRVFHDAAAQMRMPIAIVEASDGGECVERLGRADIDIAFVDVHMPHMSGLEAVWAAREIGVSTFITLMSASANEKIIALTRRLP